MIDTGMANVFFKHRADLSIGRSRNRKTSPLISMLLRKKYGRDRRILYEKLIDIRKIFKIIERIR